MDDALFVLGCFCDQAENLNYSTLTKICEVEEWVILSDGFTENQIAQAYHALSQIIHDNLQVMGDIGQYDSFIDEMTWTLKNTENESIRYKILLILGTISSGEDPDMILLVEKYDVLGILSKLLSTSQKEKITEEILFAVSNFCSGFKSHVMKT